MAFKKSGRHISLWTSCDGLLQRNGPSSLCRELSLKARKAVPQACLEIFLEAEKRGSSNKNYDNRKTSFIKSRERDFALRGRSGGRNGRRLGLALAWLLPAPSWMFPCSREISMTNCSAFFIFQSMRDVVDNSPIPGIITEAV